MPPDAQAIVPAVIADHSAVSREVALARAKGALARSCSGAGTGPGTGLALAITGFAGPGGDGDEEGLVHLAAAHSNSQSLHREEPFGAIGRDSVRLAALGSALAMMTELLEE